MQRNPRKIWLLSALLIAAAQPISAEATSTLTPGNDVVSNIPGRQRMPGAPPPIETYYPQADAYKIASEANSYLGAYWMNFGAFGKDADKDARQRDLKKMYGMIEKCLNRSSECGDEEKTTVMRALVNYNLGKDIKRMVLENNTNFEKMKSMDPNLGTHLKKGPSTARKGPFKLDEKDITGSSTFILNGRQARERDILGPVFMNEYKTFINHYSNTGPTQANWHYVPQKTPTKSGDSTYVFHSNRTTGQPIIDNARFNEDQLTQNSEQIYQARKAMLDSVKQPGLKQTGASTYQATSDINADLRSNDLGLSIRRVEKRDADGKIVRNAEGKVETLNEHESAVAIVRNINNAVDKKVEESRKNNPGQNVVVGTTIDMDRFSEFLDEIWPPNAKRQAILKNKS